MLYAKFDSNWPCVSGEVNGNVKGYDDRQLWLSLANTSKSRNHRMQRNDIPITHKFEDWQETKIPIEVVKCECASRVLWFLLFLMSHTLRDLSSEALRMYFPPGWNTSPLTQLSCPVYKKGRTSLKLLRHILWRKRTMGSYPSYMSKLFTMREVWYVNIGNFTPALFFRAFKWNT